MNCESARNLFSEYSEGTLSPAMTLALEQHLESCAECRADYAAFLQVVAILSEAQLPEVEVPAGFSKAVMAQIAVQPKPAPGVADSPRKSAAAPNPLERIVEGWRTLTQGLVSTPQRAFVTGLACALLAVGVFTSLRSHTTGGGTVSPPGLPAGMMQVPVQHTSGILQNVVTEPEGGQTYNYFGIHLPLNTPPAQIKTYVLQNESGLTDDAALNNADNATPAWNGTAEQGVSVHVPVAVVSNMPAGSTLNFLVEWAPVGSNQAEQKEIAFVPIAAQAAQPSPVNAGDSLYDVLQNISSSYKAKIFVDPSAVNQATGDASTGASGLAALTGTEGSARVALQTALSGAGYYITDEGTDSTGESQYLVSHQ